MRLRSADDIFVFVLARSPQTTDEVNKLESAASQVSRTSEEVAPPGLATFLEAGCQLLLDQAQLAVRSLKELSFRASTSSRISSRFPRLLLSSSGYMSSIARTYERQPPPTDDASASFICRQNTHTHWTTHSEHQIDFICTNLLASNW
eukprot:5938928-Amphidinium_carterae.1